MKYILLLYLVVLTLSKLTFAQAPGGVTSNLHAWWKADAGVTGDPATLWEDQSTNSFDLTSADGPSLVSDDINFHDALSFDGISNFMQVTNGLFGTDTYHDAFMFAINNTKEIGSDYFFLEALPAGARFGSHLTWSNGVVYYDVGTCCVNMRVSAPWGTSENLYHLWTLASSTETATPSGTRKAIYRDGLTLATNNNLDSIVGGSNNFYLSSNNGTNEFHDANIPEIAIYTGAPTAAEMQRIHSYFGIKYGLTQSGNIDNNGTSFEAPNASGINEGDYVSSGSIVIWDASNNSSYHNDVAGIGRDDNSDLDQQKSISTTGNRVIMDKGGAFSANEDFLIWGHDNGPLSTTSTGTHPQTSTRVTRIWKTDVTGAPGEVTVRIILGGGIPNTGNAEEYALLIDPSDNDFSTGASAHTEGAALNGDTITFTGVNFTDGSFFTLSPDFSFAPGGVIDDLHAWWKADAGVVGSPVTTWNDQGPNAFNFTSSDGPSIVGADINYHDALSFDGVSNFMQVTNGLFGTDTYLDAYMYAINKTKEIGSDYFFLEALPGGGRFGSHLVWTDSRVYYDVGTSCCVSMRVSASWGTSAGLYHLWTLASSTETTTPSGARKAIYRDGLTISTSNNLDSIVGGSNNFYLSSNNGTNEFHDANIPEISIYTGSPTAEEMQRIHSYFGIKYSLTQSGNIDNNGSSFESPNSSGINEGDYLNSDAAVIWDASNNTSFHNNIIGIARDDNSLLEQKQSKTTDDTLKIYINTLATDNASNAGSFAVNESFVLMGDNTDVLCATAASNAEAPGSITSRVAREWKVQNTNFSESFNIDVQLASCANLASISTADLRLLVDTDDDLSNATVYSTADGLGFAESGGDITITGISNAMIPSDATRFITIASVDPGTPLPIELLNFSGELIKNEVLLKWSTASEINNDYFEIERSDDIQKWKVIHRAKGAGNSSKKLNYDAWDNNPLLGVSYYRLKQVDFDGTEAYSNVIKIRNDERTEITVYPNPANTEITVNGVDRISDEILIYNALGQLVNTQIHLAHETNSSITFNIADLRSGAYVIAINENRVSFVKE